LLRGFDRPWRGQCDNPAGGANTSGRYYMTVMQAIFEKFSLIERALLAGAVVSALLLASAFAFEHAGYPPCELCLDQREAHWTALGVAIAGLIAAFVFKARLAASAGVGALALVYALSAGLAFYHTGVEHGFWPGPASCSAPVEAITDISGLGGALGEKPSGPSCGEPSWRLFGVSMAGYNLLASAALFALAFTAAASATRQAKQARRPSAHSAQDKAVDPS